MLSNTANNAWNVLSTNEYDSNQGKATLTLSANVTYYVYAIARNTNAASLSIPSTIGEIQVLTKSTGNPSATYEAIVKPTADTTITATCGGSYTGSVKKIAFIMAKIIG